MFSTVCPLVLYIRPTFHWWKCESLWIRTIALDGEDRSLVVCLVFSDWMCLLPTNCHQLLFVQGQVIITQANGIQTSDQHLVITCVILPGADLMVIAIRCLELLHLV